MKKILPTIFLIIMLTGCMFKDQIIRDNMKQGNVKLGDSMGTVAYYIGYPTSSCIRKKFTTDGEYEMWDYATNLCGSNLSEHYLFIFKDKVLIEIRTVDPQLDIQF